jgi:hypothetical protein
MFLTSWFKSASSDRHVISDHGQTDRHRRKVYMNYGYTKISGFRVYVHMSLPPSVLQLSPTGVTIRQTATWDPRELCSEMEERDGETQTCIQQSTHGTVRDSIRIASITVEL